MIIVFSAEIVQIHHIAKSVNFTLISAWVSSKTCKGINDMNTCLSEEQALALPSGKRTSVKLNHTALFLNIINFK